MQVIQKIKTNTITLVESTLELSDHKPSFKNPA